MAVTNKNLVLGFFICSLLLLCSHIAAPHSVVKFLPGFQGPLPFHLETGYIGVGELEDVQLFYYFVRSENDPKEDPLMLWLIGGPGCSAFSGLAFEIGPVNFKYAEYNGSLPTLVLNPYSWSKVSSIIFVDAPVGTGFSYARTSLASHSSDVKSAQDTAEFLRRWLNDHPEFLSNPLYVGGESYSGIIVPLVFQELSDGNEAGIEPKLNLKGYILGNPLTARHVEENSKIPFAHGMGLISDELYESLKQSCKGEYVNVDPRNAKCLEDVQAYDKCVAGLQPAHILEPLCAYASPKPNIVTGSRRSLNSGQLPNSETQLPQFGCRTYGYVLARYWLNDKKVRDALDIRKGTVGEWKRCNFELPYAKDVKGSVRYHKNLSTKGYRSLIYSGDHDMRVPFIGTQSWIRSLNYSIVDDWRPWMVEGQVGGYTRTYSNKMTYVTVKGGGHTAPEYKPVECLAMLSRWISEKPL